MKNLNSISAEVISDKALLRLGIWKRVFCFTKVTRNNKKINKEVEMVTNLEKEIKIKRAFLKEKKNAQALLLEVICPSASLSTSMPELSALSRSAIFVPGFFALLLTFMSAMPISRLFALLFQSTMLIPGSSDPLFPFTISMPGFSTLPSLFVVPVPGSFTLPSPSAMLVLELSALSSLSSMLIPRLSVFPSPFAMILPRSSTLLFLSTVFTLYLLLFLI